MDQRELARNNFSFKRTNMFGGATGMELRGLSDSICGSALFDADSHPPNGLMK